MTDTTGLITNRNDLLLMAADLALQTFSTADFQHCRFLVLWIFSTADF